jgi:hypothetical protein
MPQLRSKRARNSDRRFFIGGSDARIIMGNDEGALIRLWREKRGEVEPEDLSRNLVVQLGTATEELNRSWYERNTGHVSRGSVSVLAAKQVIPMVLAGAGDPVSTGLVVSLARPDANVTGLSLQQTDLAGKRLELLREVVPALRRLAILANAGNPVTLLDMRKVEAAAGPLGLTVVTVEIRRMEDIAPGFA